MITMIFAAMLALTGCIEDVGKDKVAAGVADVPTDAPAAKADGVKLAVTKDKSKIRALGAKVTATHPIDFNDFTGDVTINESGVAGISFAATIKTITSDHPKLTEHLLNEDFLDEPKFPTATFTSTAITAGSASEGMTHTIEGDLTIRGKTKRVTFPANVTTAGEPISSVTAKTEFVLNRQDFGVTYPGKADDLVQDNVVLTVDFTADAAE